MRFNFTKKQFGFLSAVFLVGIGTYNAVVINAESDMSGLKFVKRLDEQYGVIIPGRRVAAHTSWKKMAPAEKPVMQVMNSNYSAPARVETAVAEPVAVEASVQEELNLTLVEVVNQNLFPNINASAFSGSMITSGGAIESLAVSLPQGKGLSVSFSEMTGNVFQFDLDGEVYSAMMYQVDNNAWMVNISNGPLEGTRLRFARVSSEENQFEAQPEAVVEAPVEEQPNQMEGMTEEQLAMRDEALQAQGQTFNLEQPATEQL